MRCVSIRPSRSPSRRRDASKAVVACAAIVRICSWLMSASGACSAAASRMTSATLSAWALGSQARVLSWRLLSRCSRRALGSGIWWRLAASWLMRTSTLPRLSWLTSNSRRAGSYWRNSSGNLKDKSRNRLLTARISRPIWIDELFLDSRSEPSGALPIWALA